MSRTEEPVAPTTGPVVQITDVESLQNKKLEQLIRQEEPAAPEPIAPDKAKQADLEKANEKLSSLLNKPK